MVSPAACEVRSTLQNSESLTCLVGRAGLLGAWVAVCSSAQMLHTCFFLLCDNIFLFTKGILTIAREAKLELHQAEG